MPPLRRAYEKGIKTISQKRQSEARLLSIHIFQLQLINWQVYLMAFSVRISLLSLRGKKLQLQYLRCSAVDRDKVA